MNMGDQRPEPSTEAPARPALRTSIALGLAGLGLMALATYLGFLTYSRNLGISEFWPVTGVIWCILSVTWEPRPGLPRATRMWLAALACLVIFLVVGRLTSDFGLLTLARVGVAAVGQALAAGMIYQKLVSHGSWAPFSPSHLGRLLGATFMVSVGGYFIGAYPGTWSGQPMPATPIWWSLRNFVYMALISTIWFMLHHWRRPAVTTLRRPWQLLVLLPMCLVVPGLVYAYPTLPLSWMMLVPMAWAGLALPPRWSAVPTFLTGVGTMIGAMIWRTGFPYGSELLPAPIVLDLLISGAGALAVLLSLFRDDRGRLRMELDRQVEATKAQTAMLTAVFQSMSDGLCITDNDGTVAMINRAARGMLGHIPNEPQESWSSYFQLHTLDGKSSFTEVDSPLKAQPLPGEILHDEVRLGDGDDESARILAVTAQAVASKEGIRRVFVFRDVTQQHARQMQLKGFAHTVAHDLKQPLTTAIAWIEQVEEEIDDGNLEGGRAALRRVRATSTRMAAMIDDWLAFSVAREGVLRETTFPLRPVIDDLVRMSTDDLRTHADFAVDAPHSVYADPTLVRQLLHNLIGNAVKYSRPDEPPHIDIRSSEDAEAGFVSVSVADRGVGITPGEEERIFARFSRSDKDAGSYQGTGLGLALCKTIVSQHGGQIGAERNDQGGATFRFTLPAAALARASAT